MDLGVWWADGSCVGQSLYVLFGLWFVGYVIIGARQAQMMVTCLEGVAGFSVGLGMKNSCG